MTEDGRTVRLQVMLSSAELSAVKNFGLTHRLPTRTAAVRELLRRGLAATIQPAVEGNSAGIDSRPARH
jgi:hypothetical protein